MKALQKPEEFKKPITKFASQVEVKNCMIVFIGKNKQIQFSSFETPIIHLVTETETDTLFITDNKKYEDLWKSLKNLNDKWLEEGNTEN